ncbi:calmodulin-like protein 4 isoform X1 [Pyrgilauda ruficollis]|uniref:calmodulin-like protein 4 isoform X1 n=1 Tax=Pyrgilauda ruficollis TaxID=221976 RepID=UPI001B85D51A|nr:calmodulin-like protein 4 isoform X1 [Pyrgilauda ruficollis]
MAFPGGSRGPRCRSHGSGIYSSLRPPARTLAPGKAPSGRCRGSRSAGSVPKNEFKECFSLYDKKQKGKIKASDLLAVMRCLGASPTPGEVQRHLQLHRIDRNAELDFSTFLNIMYRQMKQEEPEEEILRALAMIDRQKRGVIAAPELRAKLTRLGEKLSDEEVDDLLREAKVGPNGTIKYEEFVHHICLPSVDY